LGIPAGVKIHSAAFARNPSSAGEVARQFLTSKQTSTRDVEVMDIDEDSYREGALSSRLYGYLRVPFTKRQLQGVKTAISPGEITSLVDIASEVVNNMTPDLLYILGPGTTTRAVASMLALEKTLLGVDIIKNRGLLLNDANEAQLLELLETRDGKIIITPIGGQGFLFGRGNQQLSPHVIYKIGIENIVIISIPEKIFSLGGQPLLVDTGDPSLDERLCGYKRIITGSGESIMYRVSI
jgi:predicted polyphosphate/ATP-dependent NAD kinase